MWDNVKYLILSLTSRCNLRCKYCYLSAKTEGSDMGDETIDRVMALADTGNPLLIQLTGGEPVLVPDKIERVVHLGKTMKRPPRFAIQTNATLLSPPLVQFWKEQKIEVGVSLDGPPDIQESLRGKVDQTLQGLQLLEDYNVPFRVTTVVSSVNIFSLDTLLLLLSRYKSCKGIGLDLLVNKGRGSSSAVTSASADSLKRGIQKMITTLKAINSRVKEPLRLRELDMIRKEKNGKSKANFCHAASGNSLAVTPEGMLYPCGQTMRDSSFSLGSLSDPQFNRKASLETFRLRSQDCLACPLTGCCPGECPSRVYHNHTEYQLACTLYRTLFAQQG